MSLSTSGEAEVAFVSASVRPVWPGKWSDTEHEGKEFSSIKCEELRVAKSGAKNAAKAYQSRGAFRNSWALGSSSSLHMYG